MLLLYVLDALDAEQKEELRAHLAGGCPACAGALAEAEATLAAVPMGLEAVEPSASVRKRLMDRIEALPMPDADRLPDNFAVRMFRILVPAAVAAGLAVIITHAVVTRNLNQAQLRSAELETLLNARQQQVETLAGQLQHQQQVVDFLKCPDLKVVQLDGGKAQPTAVAGLFCDPDTKQWLLLTKGLAPLPAGKTYELWCITASQKKIRTGTFDVDGQGNASLMMPMPTDVGPLAAAAVTDEPAGGVDQPTGSIQLLGKLQ